jgi:hypothetical protein
MAPVLTPDVAAQALAELDVLLHAAGEPPKRFPEALDFARADLARSESLLALRRFLKAVAEAKP